MAELLEIPVSGEPVIALEVGATHGGFQGCLDLIDLTKPADAIKFQMVWADTLHERRPGHPETIVYIDAAGEHEESLMELWRRRELPLAAWSTIAHYANDVGVKWFATPDSPATAAAMADMRPSAIKVAGMDMADFDLVKECCRLGVTVLLDSRAGSDDKVAEVIGVCERENVSPVIVHTPTGYPSADPNFERVWQLRHRFPETAVGFTSHHEGDWEDCQHAVQMGATYIEKGLTKNRATLGIEHTMSMEPQDVKAFVLAMKGTYAASGRQ
jgi:N,N'-diacetyllegionaminate synthase